MSVKTLMLSLLAASVAGLLLFGLTTAVQQSSNQGTVHIHIVDAAGKDLGEARVTSFDSGHKQLADLFVHNVASGIPFGSYRLKVNAPGFWTAERQVLVLQPEVWVVVQLELGMGQGEGGLSTFETSGIVTGWKKQDGPVWIRVAGIFSNAIADSKVGPTGHFALAGLAQGKYVLVVTQNGVPLQCRNFDVPLSKPLAIDLADRGSVATPVTPKHYEKPKNRGQEAVKK